MRNGNRTERALKQLESEIVFLEQQQTELLRKKWALEERIRKQNERIALLEMEGTEAKEKRSMWKKVALVFAATWAIVLSLFSIDRK